MGKCPGANGTDARFVYQIKLIVLKPWCCQVFNTAGIPTLATALKADGYGRSSTRWNNTPFFRKQAARNRDRLSRRCCYPPVRGVGREGIIEKSEYKLKISSSILKDLIMMHHLQFGRFRYQMCTKMYTQNYNTTHLCTCQFIYERR